MVKEIKILFIGHFHEVLEELFNKGFNVNALVEDKNSNKDVLNFCKRHNIAYHIVKSKKDMNDFTTKIYEKEFDYGIMASFGIILDNTFIKKFKKIINIHPGLLETQRGRHPLPTAILNKSEVMGITAHIVENNNIDYGEKVVEIIQPIYYQTDYFTNEMFLRSTLRCVTELIANYIINFDYIPSYSWEKKEALYNKPLDKNVLNKIFNLKKLSL